MVITITTITITSTTTTRGLVIITLNTVMGKR